MNTIYSHPLADAYHQELDYVISQLAQGEIPWKKSWQPMGLPQNYLTGHRYSGWNLCMLLFVMRREAYRSPGFLTFLQAREMGGCVKRGQKGYQVVYWMEVEKEPDTQNSGRSNTIRVGKRHTIFNVDQVDGITLEQEVLLPPGPDEKLRRCGQIVDSLQHGPLIRFGGDRACYYFVSDSIIMPHPKRFISEEAFYATLFHELAHSTGHPDRLGRPELAGSDGFGKPLYSQEELTAELTAAFLCAHCGIEQQTRMNSAAYIQSWLRALQDDRRLLLRSAMQAQAAADYLLGIKPAGDDRGVKVNGH